MIQKIKVNDDVASWAAIEATVMDGQVPLDRPPDGTVHIVFRVEGRDVDFAKFIELTASRLEEHYLAKGKKEALEESIDVFREAREAAIRIIKGDDYEEGEY